MATKNTLTNAQALELALALAERAGEQELAAKLAHMHAQATKPRAKGEKAPTKEQLANLALAEQVLRAMREHGEPVGSAWIMEHVRGIMSPQKCTGVMRLLLKRGEVVKADPVKGKVRYSLAE